MQAAGLALLGNNRPPISNKLFPSDADRFLFPSDHGKRVEPNKMPVESHGSTGSFRSFSFPFPLFLFCFFLWRMLDH